MYSRSVYITISSSGPIDMRPFEYQQRAGGVTHDPLPLADMCGIVIQGKARGIVLDKTWHGKNIGLRLCAKAYKGSVHEDARAVEGVNGNSLLYDQGISRRNIYRATERICLTCQHDSFDRTAERGRIADRASGGRWSYVFIDIRFIFRPFCT